MAGDRKGKLSRLLELGSLTGRVATTYVGGKVREALTTGELAQRARARMHVDNAADILDTMSKLKGAAMKVGQQAAMLAEGLDLPEEVTARLSKLHAEAEPIPFAQIKEDVESELGGPLEQFFTRFDPEPLGTASLAQAHAAQLPDGREVVVKVLHRGVEDSVATDLLALRAVLTSSRALNRSKAELDDIFDELRERLEEELDYLQEAANIHAFRQAFGDDPRVRVPAVHGPTSTERVLTMDRLPGVPVSRFVATASPEASQRAGETLAQIHYEQIFRHRMLHADPHPGNFLFEPDGRVGLLDFGSVKRFDEFWLGTYARTALAGLDGDRELALTCAQQLGAWDGKGDRSAEALWRFILGVLKGFRSGEITLGDDDDHLLEDMKPVIKAMVPHNNVRAPKDVLLLHRSLGGLYSLGRTLGLTLDFGALLRAHAEEAAARAAGR